VLERVYIETLGEVIGRKAFDEWVEEREQFAPGAWNVEARHTARAERPVLVTPYTGTYRVLPAPPPPTPSGLQTIDVAPSAFTYLDPVAPATHTTQEAASVVVPQPLTTQNIVQAYRHAAGNLTQAARLLGVHRATLYRHMQTLGLSREDLAAALAAPAPQAP
jgi:DNA-binding NtrC family response regulator